MTTIKLALQDRHIHPDEIIAYIEEERTRLHADWGKDWYEANKRDFEAIRKRARKHGLDFVQAVEGGMGVAYLIEDFEIVATLRSEADVKMYLDHLER